MRPASAQLVIRAARGGAWCGGAAWRGIGASAEQPDAAGGAWRRTHAATGGAEPHAAVAATSVLQDDQHPLRAAHHLPPGALDAILRLAAAGHAAFVVGGTVRDLLLARSPKDIDLLTSADLRTVRGLLPRSAIVGRRHPIVYADLGGGLSLEVSSLSTTADPALLPPDGARLTETLAAGAPVGRMAHVRAEGWGGREPGRRAEARSR